MKDRIKLIRKNLKMNQTEFGSAIGVSLAALSKYETGVVIPDKSIRLLICEKFNVNEAWLERGEGVPYKEGLIPSLASALRQMPNVAAALERLLPYMTPDDLEHLDSMVERIINDK